MGLPVKLSDDLVRDARTEAAATERSITAQIEHWARLGRGAESVLSIAEINAIKSWERNDERRDSTSERILAKLLRIASSDDRGTVRAEIQARGRDVYEAHPERLDRVVRIEENGRRVSGRFEGKAFVADLDDLAPTTSQ